MIEIRIRNQAGSRSRKIKILVLKNYHQKMAKALGAENKKPRKKKHPKISDKAL